MFKFKYLLSKLLYRLQISSLKNVKKHKTVKICPACNIVNSSIDRYTYLGRNNVIVNTDIGSFCSIASYCSIGGDGHYIERVSTSPVFTSHNNVFHKNFILDDSKIQTHERVKIGNDVWIGEKVFIKSGIKIGNGCIVGAHSVVTKDVPDYAIVAGVPAKIIRYRFSANEIKFLLNYKWWTFSEEKILSIAGSFLNIDKMITEANYDIKK